MTGFVLRIRGIALNKRKPYSHAERQETDNKQVNKYINKYYDEI